MRRFVWGALIAGASVAVPAVARAQEPTTISAKHSNKESPQHFAFELRFGAYRPDIDSDPALTKRPYETTFGTVPHFYFGMEFDWQALRIPHVGTLGPGIGLSHVGMSRQARLLNPPANGPAYSQENTSLEIWPMYAVAVFRLDVLNRELHIPLEPYLKAGVGLAFWRAYNDGGTSEAGGTSGKGHTFGLQTAIGVGFDLGVLDPHAAREFDNALGVNHTYLYGEYYSSDLTGIGQTSALRVGTSAFAFGLSFEF